LRRAKSTDQRGQELDEEYVGGGADNASPLAAGAPLQSWDEKTASQGLGSRALRRAKSIDSMGTASADMESRKEKPNKVGMQRLRDLGKRISDDAEQRARYRRGPCYRAAVAPWPYGILCAEQGGAA
jgi:hypothetical protein